MNPAAQQTHTTRTAQLEARILVLEALVDVQSRALLQFMPGTATELEQVRGLIAELREHLETQRAWRIDVVCAMNEIAGWSLYQRLRWLLTGRR